MRKLLIITLFLILFSYSIFAIDSFICVPTDVVEGNTITCEVDLAGGNSEKNKAWNMTWYNSSAQVVPITDCSFAGTTSNVNNPPDIVQGCSIPSNWGDSAGNATVNFTLTSIPSSEVFYYNVSQDSSIDLTLDGFVVESPCYLGQLCGLQFTVKKSETAKTVLGADCTVDILELRGGNLIPIEAVLEGESRDLISKYDGHILTDIMATSASLEEDRDYIIEARCDCRAGKDYCYDDDGTSLTNATSYNLLRGVGTATLSINQWLETTTSVNLLNIELKQRNTVSVNITNNRTDIRVPIEVDYDCRINSDNDNSKRRIKSPFYFPECQTFGECDVIRGISAETTQEQSTDFVVEEHPFLQGRQTEAVCTTNVKIIDIISDLVSYSTTSNTFFINSSTMNIRPDWQWVSDLRLNSIVNLTDSMYDDYNGTGTGNIDLEIHQAPLSDLTERGQLDIINAINIFNLISNITIKNLTGTLVEHLDYELEFLDDENVEIELRNVNLDKHSRVTWWNITLEFYDLNLRITEATEGIEDKTGTFHFGVNCPNEAEIGLPMSCLITAQVEDSQQMEKEVDFTCYISDNGNQLSSINWNQMITRAPTLMEKEFYIPTNFHGNSNHILQCEAGYYNLGSRTDQFYDTFRAILPVEGKPEETAGAVTDEIIPEPFSILDLPGDIAVGTKDALSKAKEIAEKYPFVAIFLIVIVLCSCYLHWIGKKEKEEKRE